MKYSCQHGPEASCTGRGFIRSHSGFGSGDSPPTDVQRHGATAFFIFTKRFILFLKRACACVCVYMRAHTCM